jgi:hypothetical protein
MQPNAMVEIASQAANRSLVANIRSPKPAGRQAAEVIRRLDKNNTLSHAMCLNRGNNPGRCATIDYDVSGFYCPENSKIARNSKPRSEDRNNEAFHESKHRESGDQKQAPTVG